MEWRDGDVYSTILSESNFDEYTFLEPHQKWMKLMHLKL